MSVSRSSLFNVHLSCFDSFDIVHRWYLAPSNVLDSEIMSSISFGYSGNFHHLIRNIWNEMWNKEQRKKLKWRKKWWTEKKRNFNLTLSDTHKYTGRHTQKCDNSVRTLFACFSLSLTHRLSSRFVVLFLRFSWKCTHMNYSKTDIGLQSITTHRMDTVFFSLLFFYSHWGS